MRHSRKSVMTERYKLYMRKHILNGRYLERNLQIVMCMVLVVALTVGCVAVGVTATNAKHDGEQVSVKEALFGSNETNAKKVSKDKNIDSDVANADDNADVAKVTDVAAVSESATGVASDVDELVEAQETSEETKLFDDRCIANVEETLNIRSEANEDAEFVGSMEPGAIAIVEGTDGDWTKIKSGDVEGYVLTKYVLTGQVAESFAKDYVILHGTILEDGVNIRAIESTEADIVAVLDKDAVVTVLEDPNQEEDTQGSFVETNEVVEKEASTEEIAEESEDEITWVRVRLEDGEEGYVSDQLISIDELYQVAVSAQELERQAAEAEAARIAEEKEKARKAASAASAASTATKTTSSSSSNNSGNSYQGAVTTPITAASSGESIGTFTVTAYCGCSRCSGGNGYTASGTVPTQGRTIAADTSVLPYGTQVVIGGVVYTVEDCGSGVNGNHIDIFFATHEQAMAFGRQSLQVYKY